MSYGQIKRILGVSKSTLSYWLRDYPLSEKRMKALQKVRADRSEFAIERFRATMRHKKEKRREELYKNQKRNILPLNKGEIFLAGLMLYWGEGTKGRMDALAIANSDPTVIKFFIYWLTNILSVPRNKIKIQLHLYSDMNIDGEIKYWSDILKISKKQFNRPYIKKTSSKRINHKGGFGHGTCQARIGDTLLAEKIFMSLKVISKRHQQNYLWACSLMVKAVTL